MPFQGRDIQIEHKRDGRSEREATCTQDQERAHESNLVRLGKKLKFWVLNNGNLTYIPDIQLMSDDDRS